ncbi:hypothetical protein A3K29_05910 [Candidatus Collierbacteria bacterium RIFOXYB2_FULL_46_14]|nr:MAG: hypothetical protein A3K29_05910 [Candidatus Collierbacteria bacterium RIFOXYB2_FULL_46_14]OGD76666.1 MAG: hypothetical protein A3K43_05910 [Candidatus Collierbacteria bacterium RIFOXYA2_FULL_46_20]OGD78002.1 MAG: hypothetical protein A3K39_05910 [Candidatus Collierbacteria bacterium RIFOXYC2_FULL_43_15]OGD80026.1 MAG: hypothetical protein A2320_00340 [Pseudomonadales bacterium GWC2_63_15]OGD82724.1 MAG: hypothetical protein A3K36_05910 [Candidatus Collierbacteria bacterium RIFOXYD2_FUL
MKVDHYSNLKNTNRTRFWQIDAVRGLAVVGMVIYHLLFDLEYLFQLPLNVSHLPLIALARSVAVTFILLIGFSVALKFETIKRYGPKQVILAFVKKAVTISLYALLITLVTYLIFPQGTIIFGILHFISLSLVLLIPFLYLRSNGLVALLATVTFVLGLAVPNVTASHSWLLILGMTSSTFSSLDYFPLLPWFAVVLFGLVLGRKYSPALQKPSPSKTPPLFLYRIVSKLGKHSLPIYLWHQPVLWTILFVIKYFL